MFAPTAVGIVCASALVTAGAAPATAAQQDRNHHALEVTVCKQVRDRGHGHDGDDRSRRFELQARTDRDSVDFRLRDHECTSFSLDFRRSSFTLEESQTRDDVVDFRAHGDVERSESHDNQLRVRFDTHQGRPRVFVMVTNREHGHGHGGRDRLSR